MTRTTPAERPLRGGAVASINDCVNVASPQRVGGNVPMKPILNESIRR